MDDALQPFFLPPSWPLPSRDKTRPPAPAPSRARVDALRDAAENDALAQLIGAVASGDKQALERLYARSLARVYALALRITQRRETAEEVIEDVYVQVWQTARHFDPSRGSPLAWLLTICRSRSLDARRRMDPAILSPDPCEWLDSLTPAGVTPQDVLEATQDHTALHRALATLAPAQRQLIGLAFLRGLTHAELSRQLELPLGTVKSRMRQALADLRQALGPSVD